MFNTSTLFARKAQSDAEKSARFDLRVMQMLYKKVCHIDVVEQLEEDITAKIPFLEYQSTGFTCDPDEWASDELLAKVEQSPLLKRHITYARVKNLAYAMETTLGELELPFIDMLIKRGADPNTPARKIFTARTGAMPMLKHLLGEGLDIVLDKEILQTIEGGSSIVVGINRWSIVFTGRQKLPLTIPLGINPQSSIGQAFTELISLPPWIPGVVHLGGRYLSPFWMREEMSDAMVAWCEQGNEVTSGMMDEMNEFILRTEVCDPGPWEGDAVHALWCNLEGCDGEIGKGGFCRQCSDKCVELRECPMGGPPHKVLNKLRFLYGSQTILGSLKCSTCNTKSSWVVSHPDIAVSAAH